MRSALSKAEPKAKAELSAPPFCNDPGNGDGPLLKIRKGTDEEEYIPGPHREDRSLAERRSGTGGGWKVASEPEE